MFSIAPEEGTRRETANDSSGVKRRTPVGETAAGRLFTQRELIFPPAFSDKGAGASVSVPNRPGGGSSLRAAEPLS